MNAAVKSMILVAALAIAALSVLPSDSAEASSDIPEVYVTDGDGTKIDQLVYSPGILELDTVTTSAGTTYYMPVGTELSKSVRCLYIDYGKAVQFKAGVKVQAGAPQKLLDAGLRMTISYDDAAVGSAAVSEELSYFQLDSQDSMLDPGMEYRISLVTTAEVGSEDLDDLTGTVRFEFTIDAEIEAYTVTIKPNSSSYGSVSKAVIENVLSGTAVHVSGSTITIGAETVTATPAPSTQTYTYSFESWSVADGTEVTQDMEITATFRASYTPGPDPPTPPTPPGPTPDPSHEEHTYHNDDGSTTYEVIDRTKNPDGSSTVRTSETTVGTDSEGTEFENVVVVEETTYSSGRDYTEIRSESRDYTDGSSEYDYIELNQYRDGSTAGTEIHTSTQADGSYSTETTTKGTDAAGVYSYETVVEHYIVLTDGTASYRSTDSDGSVTVEAEASNSDGTVTTALEGDQIITTIDSTEVDGKRMLDATEQIDALDGVRQLDIQDGSTVYSEAFALAGESQVTLSIASEGGSLVLPAGVSSHIAGNVDYTTLTLVIEDGDDESLTPAQRQATGDKAVIVKLLDQDGNEVHELGGVAKIRFAYDIPQGESAEDMRVVYISDSGETEEMAYTYAQGMVEAEVPHLSVYSVVFGKDSAGSNGTLLIVLGAAVICITAGAAFVVYRRSRA
ncbi:MAG: hypothetical protein II933_03190 [Candidatus Methanomethylophilaceae archaeon]|nr:hypothetical protein [Candidatus Methanomethylophilaceae archaeon]